MRATPLFPVTCFYLHVSSNRSTRMHYSAGVKRSCCLCLYTRRLLTFIDKILMAAADLVCDLTHSRVCIIAFKGLPGQILTVHAGQIVPSQALSAFSAAWKNVQSVLSCS